ncbi:MAG: hypothetical protein DRI73_05790 [Bacteroidetes bacterium]|nr:MAG: hypothetical protein DRI73_05790 [Bacteroidota bacterium]
MSMNEKLHLNGLVLYYHLLSIDVILGVLAGAIMAVKITGIHPGLAWWVVLPFSVWWIYLTDHYIDGLRHRELTKNPRHLFFFKNRYTVLLVLIMISLINLVLILVYLPFRIIIFGGIAGLIVILYLAGVKFLKTQNFLVFPKEIIVAILYVAGIWGSLMFYDLSCFNYELLILIIAYFLVTVMNLFIYSFYEEKTDMEDGQITIFTYFGRKKAKIIMIAGLLLSIFFVIYHVVWEMSTRLGSYGLILILFMLIFQTVLVLYSSYFQGNFRYRWMNEGVFLLPVVFMLFD